MVTQLPPQQRIRYLLPLGGIDVRTFVADVLPHASGSRALCEALSGMLDNEPEDLRWKEVMYMAWQNTPAAVRHAMPATAVLAAECGRAMLAKELQAALNGVKLEENWWISDFQALGSELRDDVRTVLEQGAFIKSLARDEQGRLVLSEEDRRAVDRLTSLLPIRMRKQFDSADELAQALLNAFRVLDTNAKKVPHPEADRQ
jgi:hypothetical protein